MVLFLRALRLNLLHEPATKKALRFAICFELKKARFFFVVVAVPSTGKSKDYFEIISVKFSSAWSLRESNIVELCFARETRDSSISLTPRG